LTLHSFLIVFYLAAAAAVAHFLPSALPKLAAPTGLVWAAVALAIFAIGHATFAVLRNRRAMTREIKTLQDAHGKVMRELGYARAEVVQIHDALSAAAEAKGTAPKLRDVANEVQTLRREIERLHEPEPAPEGEGEDVNRTVTPMTPDDLAQLDDAAILDIVREAIDTDRVDLYLQPIVSLPQRKHRFYECFSRIRDRDDNMIGPEAYLEIAEREGLIAAIDNILLIRCVQLVRKVQQKRKNVGFFVNISPHTLADRKFFAEFVLFMEENSELAPNLVFEFAQADIIDLPAETAGRLHQLGELGFRFSLDRVKRLDLNYPELSRRYIRYLKVESDALKAWQAQAHSGEGPTAFKSALDRYAIDIVVERMEDEEELRELLDYGIDYGQGYLFGEPRPAR
jgi:cyclic-di-GMP phosphodiesterase TipF (flagellum assembly factor)